MHFYANECLGRGGAKLRIEEEEAKRVIRGGKLFLYVVKVDISSSMCLSKNTYVKEHHPCLSP